MDSFEFTKIAGAVLAALLLIVGMKTASEIAHEGHGSAEHSEVGYTLPAAKETVTDAKSAETDGKGGAPAASAFDPAKVVAAIATAKPDNGAATFKKCQACHSGEKGGGNKVGPNLWGVVNRPKGSVDGFGYSDGMKAKGGAWNYADLASFVHNPKEYVAGTKMQFAGVPDTGDLADLLAYLRTLADTPAPLPGK